MEFGFYSLRLVSVRLYITLPDCTNKLHKQSFQYSSQSDIVLHDCYCFIAIDLRRFFITVCLRLSHFKINTRMWANAQRDGRPAEYRWRPLFNAAKFGWRPLLECRAVMLPRRETRWKLQGCPKLANFSAVRPKFTTLWGHLEEILLLNKFFSDCRYVP